MLLCEYFPIIERTFISSPHSFLFPNLFANIFLVDEILDNFIL